MKNAYKGQINGFTLIELLVVVLIIGILASVTLPQYEKAVAKSRYVNLVTAGKSLKDAMEAFYLANGDYPQQWDQLDIEYPGCEMSPTGRYMLWCDKFAVDMFGISNPNLRLWDTHGIENNGKGLDTGELNAQSKALYTIWLDHSPNPGKTECRSPIQGLCKSMGYPN